MDLKELLFLIKGAVQVAADKMDEKGRFHALELKVGDQILFSPYSGTEYSKDGVDYLILTEDDVLATV